MPTKAELDADLKECQKACKGHVKLLTERDDEVREQQKEIDACEKQIDMYVRQIERLEAALEKGQGLSDIVQGLTARAERAENRVYLLCRKFYEWQHDGIFSKVDYQNLATAIAADMTQELTARNV